MSAGLARSVESRDRGAGLIVRPAGQEDKEQIQALVRGLSPRSRYLRFFNGVRELSPQWLERFARAVPDSGVTLLALVPDRDQLIPVGMAQYATDPYPHRGEFAVVVDDAWQGMGIGSQLIGTLVHIARDAGIERMEGEVLVENALMLRLVRSMGFEVCQDPQSELYYRVSMPLSVITFH
jgi:acetyltransferase